MYRGYFSNDDDTTKPIQELRTPDFEAGPSDTLLISLGTDVTSGDFLAGSSYSPTWGGSFIKYDDIVLESASLPVTVSGFTLE